MAQMEACLELVMLMHTRQSQQRSVTSAEHICRDHSVVLHKGKRSEVAKARACTAALERSVCPAVLHNSDMLKQALIQLYNPAMSM